MALAPGVGRQKKKNLHFVCHVEVVYFRRVFRGTFADDYLRAELESEHVKNCWEVLCMRLVQ